MNVPLFVKSPPQFKVVGAVKVVVPPIVSAPVTVAVAAPKFAVKLPPPVDDVVRAPENVYPLAAAVIDCAEAEFENSVTAPT